jgi:hypothetical protein
MSTRPPKHTLRDADVAARSLLAALRGRGTEFTIADAAAKSGLPLQDAERGMHALVRDYRGHLRVTEAGDLLFRFPLGFDKPWEQRTRAQRTLRRVGAALAATGRFIVRAWVAIVLVGYTALFVAVLIALFFARSSDSRSSNRSFGSGLSYLVLRGLADAFFWTFHPLSPFSAAGRVGASVPRSARKDEGRFYERVNRFFFGPPDEPVEPQAMEKKLLAEIRAQKGRIGLADVMRVTGLPRSDSDVLMASLMVDYDGDVEVSEQGGITYRFAELRRTAEVGGGERPPPVWAKKLSQKPLTGSSFGANLVIVLLNGFNLVMSWWALGVGLTLEKLGLLLSRVPMEELPPGGTAVALGIVPLVFSLALFALPITRYLLRGFEARRIARENGRRALLREVLTGVRSRGVQGETLQRAYEEAAGRPLAEGELTREIVALGGDVDLASDGSGGSGGDGVRYRFPDLELEARALDAEREAASEEEARLGPVVFTTEA